MKTMEKKEDLFAYEQPVLMELQLGRDDICAGDSGEGLDQGEEINE